MASDRVDVQMTMHKTSAHKHTDLNIKHTPLDCSRDPLFHKRPSIPPFRPSFPSHYKAGLRMEGQLLEAHLDPGLPLIGNLS